MVATPYLCFTQVLGQEKAKNMIRRSLVAERLPHAYIFRGPGGVGKSLFARGLAAAVNCRSEDQVEACGSCSSCRKFGSMNHPDFQVVKPDKGAIKIDQIRKLTKDLGYAPFESTMRIIVLEDVHTMRAEAANSLLKTLEEPPPDNLLILTADSSRQILSTLTSRCQVIPFTSLSLEQTTDILVQQGIERETAHLFSRLSEGSPGRSLMLHKKDMIALLEETIVILSNRTIDPDRDVSDILILAGKLAGLKEDLPTLFGLLKLWLRDQLMGEEGTAFIAEEKGTPLKSWSSRELFAKLQSIEKAERELARNCNKNLVCEVLLFTLQK